MWFVLLAQPLLAARPSAPPSERAEVVLGGPRHTTIDLWRPWAGADKLLIPATLPDGQVELFLLDTGAATSVITEELAERLNLDATSDSGFLAGLSGTVPWRRTMLPRLQVGDFELRGVDVAVGVPGVPDHLGPFPVAGILGTNVWANFVCTVDYPADILELALAGETRLRGRSAPMIVRDGGAATPVELTAVGADGLQKRATVLLEVDTGAHDVLLVGASGEPFREVSSTGEEPVLGIGANLDELPDAQILKPTRRVALTQVRVGGATLPVDIAASWLGSEPDLAGPSSIPGLIGFEVFSESVIVLDYPGGTFRVGKSRRPPRSFDATGAWLAAHPPQPDDSLRMSLDRAGVAWSRGERDLAFASVLAAAERAPDDTEALTVLSSVQRLRGDVEGAVQTLERLTPEQLAEEDMWTVYLDTLILLGRPELALSKARAALVEAKDREEMLVALSDALLATGQLEAAAVAVDEANQASARGSGAHLLRKARISEALGDRYGAMVALRELLSIVPIRGQPLWWYGLLVEEADVPTFVRDAERAMDRLHPGDEPYDFLGAAWMAVGEVERARVALEAGLARDCHPLPASPDRLNCEAWYLALGGADPARAQAQITSALAAEPENSAFLDTAAVVALAAGRPAEAADFARRAAMLSPDDPYLLWQLSRMEALARP